MSEADIAPFEVPDLNRRRLFGLSAAAVGAATMPPLRSPEPANELLRLIATPIPLPPAFAEELARSIARAGLEVRSRLNG